MRPTRPGCVYHADTPTEGRALAQTILASFPHCPIPEIARHGKTLRTWRDAFLSYFDTGGANNGGTEAVNGLTRLALRGPPIPCGGHGVGQHSRMNGYAIGMADCTR